MRVSVAGATGAIGKQLVPRLVEAGHEVHGMTRSESKQAMLYELVGVPPSVYRRQAARATAGMPSCVAKQVTRPIRNREVRARSRT
jgi:nucleoside-diphosphate-sugar epimerase